MATGALCRFATTGVWWEQSRSLHRSNVDEDEGAKRALPLLCWSILQASQPFDANGKKKKDNDGQTVKQTKGQVTCKRQHLSEL